MFPSPWEYGVSVVRHHYYDRKPAFERSSDRYEEWAVFAVEQGSFHYHIGAASGEAWAGQLVLCPPGVIFRRELQQEISFHYFLFHWLDGQGKPAAAAGYPSGSVLRFQSEERFNLSLSSLRSPTLAQHPTYRLWISHVLLDLFRVYTMEADMPMPPDRQLVNDPQMEEARRMLDTACDEPITIGAVAHYFDMNGVQFSRRFHRAYGVNPSAYVEKLRLDKVCHLLTHTAMTIEQIALASGYSNGFYLSRHFSSKMHMSPSTYRNQHRV